jgi:hypothetical protein
MFDHARVQFWREAKYPNSSDHRYTHRNPRAARVFGSAKKPKLNSGPNVDCLRPAAQMTEPEPKPTPRWVIAFGSFDDTFQQFSIKTFEVTSDASDLKMFEHVEIPAWVEAEWKKTPGDQDEKMDTEGVALYQDRQQKFRITMMTAERFSSHFDDGFSHFISWSDVPESTADGDEGDDSECD